MPSRVVLLIVLIVFIVDLAAAALLDTRYSVKRSSYSSGGSATSVI
jgi:hypothetical protein